MSDDISVPEGQAATAAAEAHATLFAHLVLQQSNMAMMLMGKVPNPQSGETMKDLESARFFIDTLEMLEAKTTGNLNKEEAGLLRQSLMTLRLGYVEAVNEPGAMPAATQAQPAAAAPTQPAPASPAGEPASKAAAVEDDDHRKKFSKKY